MSNTLLPCPFCGEEAEVTTRDVEPQGDPWYGKNIQTFVICTNCGACLFDDYFHEGFADEHEATTAWNRRAGDDTNVATNNAVPVVRGEWNPIFKGADTCKCSVCKRKGVSDSDYGFIATPYCPNCGAKMEDKT
jgi:Lar family restriction alleviation protein